MTAEAGRSGSGARHCSNGGLSSRWTLRRATRRNPDGYTTGNGVKTLTSQRSRQQQGELARAKGISGGSKAGAVVAGHLHHATSVTD